MKLKDKTIIVTGGGNGLGRELVLQLLTKGSRVVAIDISDNALTETVRFSGDYYKMLKVYNLDITDRTKVINFADTIIKEVSSIDGIINNAGIIQPFKRVNDLDFGTIDKVMNVDFFGTLNLIKAFLPHLLERSEAFIVNVSSMGGLFPVPGQIIYGAAKSAVKLLTEGLQAELRNTPVKVTLICPGAIETDIKFNSGIEKESRGKDELKSAMIKPVKPSKAAETIINSVEKSKKKVLIGTDIKTLNMIQKLLPGLTSRLISKQMESHIIN
jgi:short-subunit dehydrogenase